MFKLLQKTLFDYTKRGIMYNMFIWTMQDEEGRKRCVILIRCITRQYFYIWKYYKKTTVHADCQLGRYENTLGNIYLQNCPRRVQSNGQTSCTLAPSMPTIQVNVQACASTPP